MNSISLQHSFERAEDDMDIAGHQLAMSLRCAYLTMHRMTNACFAEFGLSADSFTVLTILVEYGAMTQKELVHKISSDANTISAMLNRLERNKLIIRKRDPHDGRARLVQITAKGRRIQTKLWEKSRSLRLVMASLFDSEELSLVVNSLTHMAQRMEDHTLNGKGKNNEHAKND